MAPADGHMDVYEIANGDMDLGTLSKVDVKGGLASPAWTLKSIKVVGSSGDAFGFACNQTFAKGDKLTHSFAATRPAAAVGDDADDDIDDDDDDDLPPPPGKVPGVEDGVVVKQLQQQIEELKYRLESVGVKISPARQTALSQQLFVSTRHPSGSSLCERHTFASHLTSHFVSLFCFLIATFLFCACDC
jgi:hypothetical protein